MTLTLQESRALDAAEKRPSHAAPLDDTPPTGAPGSEAAAEPAPPRLANPRRRTILSQLIALGGGPEGRSIDPNGLCLDLPGEYDRITIDDEFALACPKVAQEEAVALERNLVKSKRCNVALVVWRFNGLYILIEGHHRLFYCLKHQLSFRVEFLDLPSREAALRYIHDEQIGRRNLSDEGAANQRGKRYNSEKQAHGGAERKSSVHVGHLKTEERLALEFGVSATTIRRDAKLAEALAGIVENCGAEARHAILARGSGVSRAAIGRLAEMEASEQREAIDMFFECGKLPPQPTGDGRHTLVFTLPTRLAEKLLRHFGASDAAELVDALVRLPDNHVGWATPTIPIDN